MYVLLEGRDFEEDKQTEAGTHGDCEYERCVIISNGGLWRDPHPISYIVVLVLLYYPQYTSPSSLAHFQGHEMCTVVKRAESASKKRRVRPCVGF